MWEHVKSMQPTMGEYKGHRCMQQWWWVTQCVCPQQHRLNRGSSNRPLKGAGLSFYTRLQQRLFMFYMNIERKVARFKRFDPIPCCQHVRASLGKILHPEMLNGLWTQKSICAQLYITNKAFIREFHNKRHCWMSAAVACLLAIIKDSG